MTLTFILKGKANPNKIKDMGDFLCCLKINSVISHPAALINCLREKILPSHGLKSSQNRPQNPLMGCTDLRYPISCC